MTQRNVELVIGRLVTDEEFRQRFAIDPHRSLYDLVDRGIHLSASEIAALMTIDAHLWPRVAAQIDPRLQKAALRPDGAPDQP